MPAGEQRTEAAMPAGPAARVHEQRAVDAVADVLSSPGSPLPAEVRFSMEAVFGTDLGGVRLHSDGAAERSAADLGARAYTVGDHVVLGRDAHAGDAHQTLAHELSHVVQQRGAPATPGSLPVSHPGDSSERAADAASHRAISGAPVTGLARTGRQQLSRQVPRGQEVQPPQVGRTALDAQEAAERVTLALFDSHGFFQAVRDVLAEFQHDMTTELGWYAGGRTAPAPQSSMAGRVATGAAADIAKTVGKSALSILLQGLSGGLVAGGPAGAAAGLLVGAITTVVGDLDSYRPVVLAEAQKPAHQVLIESIGRVVGHEQDALRDRWTAQITESVRQLGAGGLSRYAQQISEATDRVRSSFYLTMVTAYLSLGTGGQAVELQTPHAPYTGVGRGFKVFQGSRYWVESIAADEVYVEFTARGYAQGDVQIVRTVVPRLPSTVLAELNANPDPGSTLANLPFRRLVMEGNTPVGPAKVMWDPASGTLTAADIPHFSKLFLLNIARAAGDDTNWSTGQDLSSGEHNGAVHLYSWIITRPIGQLHFSS